MTRLGALLAISAAVLPASPAAAQGWAVSSGSGPRELQAVISLDAAGAPAIAIRRGARQLLPPGELGLRTATTDLTRGLRRVGLARTRVITERYATVAGKRRRHVSRLRERVLTFAGAGGARLELHVRVAHDGLAYRYRLPERRAHRVLSEASAFRLPTAAPAWTSGYVPDDPAQSDPSNLLLFYESPRTEQPAGQVSGEIVYPALFSLGRGEHALITESGLNGGYAGTHLRAAGGGRFEVALPRPDGRVATAGPLTTPWRTIVLGSLARVVRSDLVQDLAPRSRIRDTSWIRPGSAAWSWNVDTRSPRSYARQRQYVRYASRRGWRNVVVDEGWSARWMPALVRYARRRGVGVWLWSRYSELRTRAERAAKLSRWRRWGVAGVKIDFLLCDCQQRMRWLDDVLARTARLRLMVNFHGTTIPRGIERTWPHVLTVEAVQGGEFYNAYTRLGIPESVRPHEPSSLVTLPFTRNVVGSMDFTPVLFSSTNRLTSEGFELGTAVVYESGLQHWADGIAGYRARPAAERILERVPVAWDETRLLAGRPGREAVLARRREREWWIGAISATGARTSRVALGFLRRGRWTATLVGDRPGGGLRERRLRVRPRTTLRVPLARAGGYVVRLVPRRGG